MNYQTKEISDWLDKSGIVNSRREDISKLQDLVELSLLVKGNEIHPTDYIKNMAITEFLKHVQWGELIYNPSAWDDYEYKDEEEEVYYNADLNMFGLNKEE